MTIFGRPLWCKCGQWNLWSGDVWSMHNSQHLLDAYSFSHILHGLIFYAVLRWLWPSLSLWRRALIAFLIETAWEILENSPIIIERYRAATISLDYFGDSAANIGGDIAMCMLGFWLAARLPTRWSVAFFVAVEIGMLLWIRDNLTLNVVMLLYPLEWIRRWQAGG